MEEDIEFIKYYMKQYFYEDISIEDDFQFEEAIKNLLTRYKDIKRINSDLQGEQEQLYNKIDKLEEENKKLKKVKSDELIINNPWLFEYLNELYIFKGKVKEKIEELDEVLYYAETEEGMAELKDYEYDKAKYGKKILQELLREE